MIHRFQQILALAIVIGVGRPHEGTAESEDPIGNPAELSTVVSLVDAHMGIAILPASAVKHSVASVVACNIVDRIPMSEIGIAVRKGIRPAVVENFRNFALEKLGRSRKSLRAEES